MNAIDPQKKCAGLLVPVFTLRRRGDWGIGDTQAVLEALQFCRSLHFTVLQLLPINETGADHSPYNAISSVALDPVYIHLDPKVVPGLTVEGRSKILEAEDLDSLNLGSVHYTRVKALKQNVLNEAFEVFLKSKKLKAFEKFQKEEAAWLVDYTLFRTLLDYHQGNVCWTSWIDEHRHREKAEQWIQEIEDASFWQKRRTFHAYVQWVAWTQWGAVRAEADRLRIKIMGDIPFGVSRYSADVWSRQELFDLEWSGGAPPEKYFKTDLFTEKWGQNWGIPLYHWDNHVAQNYSWWRQRVQKTSEVFQLFRIDHVLGFYRIYSFPWNPERNHEFVDLTEEQAKLKTGGNLPGFKPGPDDTPESALTNQRQGEERLKMILDAAGKTGVVAEDLGVVPSYVPDSLRKLGIPGFTIPTFVRDPQTREFTAIENYLPLSLTTFATHDHPPLKVVYEEMVQHWLGPDGHEGWQEIQRLMRWLGVDDEKPPTEFTPEIHRRFLDRLLESQSWLAVLMLSDLMGTRERYNSPGSMADSNWSFRLEKPLSEVQDDQEHHPLFDFIRNSIEKHGRSF
ncbi:MAG: 4-alpha-glucanotransferase [Verrucomicrobiota bacterium]